MKGNRGEFTSTSRALYGQMKRIRKTLANFLGVISGDRFRDNFW